MAKKKKAFVVTGLGYGDEGKGKVAHWLCSKHKAHTVIRIGGPQALHRVFSAGGKEHVHAQFGSGTLSGAATHLSKSMVIDPYAVLSEGKSLESQFGIRALEKLTIHKDALVITPFQAIANRLRELSRSSARLGSVGIGVGDTVLDAESFPETAVWASDLNKSCLLDKLLAIQKRKIQELEEVIHCIDDLPKDVQDRARFEAENLKSRGTVEWALGWFTQLASMAKIVDTNYVAEKILGRSGIVVFEGSQGVLLDRWHGFHPYTTKVRVIPQSALSLIEECGYNGEVKSLGVLRAYHTRHGAGPFVAECSDLKDKLPEATNSDSHMWQGKFRVGCFDFVAAKYAVEVCSGTLDGLVLTCVDRIKSLGEWKICRSYSGLSLAQGSGFFSKDNTGMISGITVFRGLGALQLKRQETLGRWLGKCFPNITTFKIDGNAINLCRGMTESELEVPIVAVSMGPTEKDCIEFTN